MTVNKIENVHFFKFTNTFRVENDCHAMHELVFVSTNELEIKSPDFSGVLKKGELIIHAPNTPHSHVCPSGPSEIIIIDFACDSDDLKPFCVSPAACSEPQIQKLAELVLEARGVFAPPYDKPTEHMRKKKSPPYCGEQMLKILLEYFLIDLIRQARKAENKALSVAKRSSPSVQSVIDYLDVNFAEKITLEELAFIFCTNRTTLCREFKRATGKSPIEYADRKKAEFAKTKIACTDETLTQIADELNFSAIYAFSRFFKKQTGLTPKAYRERIKK